MTPNSLACSRGFSVWITAPIKGHREIRLEVLRLVPQQRSDAVPILDPEIRESASKPTSALRAPREIGAVDRTVTTARDHRAALAEALGALNQRRQREWIIVHHQAVQHRLAHLSPFGVLAFELHSIDHVDRRASIDERSLVIGPRATGLTLDFPQGLP